MTRKLRAWTITNTGHTRPVNEDACFSDPEHGVFVVADGMGGKRAGDVASQLIVDRIRNEAATLAEIAAAGDGESDRAHRERVLDELEINLEDTNHAIYRAGRGEMGSTADLLVIDEQAAYLGHVGDSRVYLFRDDELIRLTDDHTYAERLRRGGADVPHVTPAQIERFGFDHVLTRSLGARPHVRPDSVYVDVRPGDRFLLCTDGLSNYFSQGELLEYADRHPEDVLLEALVDEAMARGGEDNLTAILVEVPAEPDHDFQPADSLDTIRKIQFFEEIRLFEELEHREILRVLSHVYQQAFSAGDYLIRDGDTTGSLFVIISGEVRVEQDGNEVARLQPGEHVGELTLVSDRPRSADVIAQQHTEVLSLPRERFARLVRQTDPMLGNKLLWNLLRHSANRLRDTTANIL